MVYCFREITGVIPKYIIVPVTGKPKGSMSLTLSNDSKYIEYHTAIVEIIIEMFIRWFVSNMKKLIIYDLRLCDASMTILDLWAIILQL